MRMRRKGDRAPATSIEDSSGADAADDGQGTPQGPFDVDEVPEDKRPPIDLGALLVAPGAGRDLRVQMDEKTGTVRSVLLADQSGAVELRAFAAPRGGDLWGEIRPQIAADTARRGGTATEREGAFGTELVCEVQVKRADGVQGTQVSRVVGVNGPRWLLRATFLGDPAKDPAGSTGWEDLLRTVVVRRGNQAMPVGEQLTISLPEGARARAPQAPQASPTQPSTPTDPSADA